MRHKFRDMISDKELISKIKELKAIKPKKEWVFLTKNQILKEESSLIPEKTLAPKIERFFSLFLPNLFLRPRLKPVFVASLIIFLFLGLFGFAQQTVPGDFLYPLKKITEQSKELFASQEELPKVQLEMANKRLEELTKIVEKNEVKKLAPAINEFHQNVEKAAKSLVNSTSSDPQQVKDLIREAQKIKEQKEKVESMGVVVGGTEELDNAISLLVEKEIKNFENRILTEKQEELLNQAKEYAKEKDYSKALELILQMSYPQP